MSKSTGTTAKGTLNKASVAELEIGESDIPTANTRTTAGKWDALNTAVDNAYSNGKAVTLKIDQETAKAAIAAVVVAHPFTWDVRRTYVDGVLTIGLVARETARAPKPRGKTHKA